MVSRSADTSFILPQMYERYKAVAVEAAEKGKALQVGLQAMVGYVQKGVVLKRNSRYLKSNVFICNKYKVVFKQADRQSREEETLAIDLFRQFSAVGIVKSFQFRNLEPSRFGISILDHEDEQRSLCISYNAKKSDKRALASLLAQDKVNLYRALLCSIKNTDDLHQRYVYFVPNLKQLITQQAYLKCEKLRWRYFNADGLKPPVDFKTLQICYLRDTTILRSDPVITNPFLEKLQPQDFVIAMNVTWECILPEVFYQVKNKHRNNIAYKPFKNVLAKPFIADMQLLHDLRTDSVLCNRVLERLTDQAVYTACLTGRFQFLDLHDGNIGVAPVYNPDYASFYDAKFCIVGLPAIHSFQDLQQVYLNNMLPTDCSISYDTQDNQSSSSNHLNNLPHLKNALEGPWQFVFFDLQLFMAEDNLFICQKRRCKTEEESIIPLRSALLELDWKDKPLSKAVIHMLEHDEEQTQNMWDWIYRKDAPIRQHLSKQAQFELDRLLDQALRESKYTLSYWRSQSNKTITISDLQYLFSQDLAENKQGKYSKLWKFLENELSYETVLFSDTLESFAKRHRMHAERVIELNSCLHIQPFEPGLRLRVECDLTSGRSLAIAKRFCLAQQLFPRLTWRQKDALLERQNKTKEYLFRYRQLTAIKERHSKHTIEILKHYIDPKTNPATPLSTLQAKKLLRKLAKKEQSLLANQTELEHFYQEIVDLCQPTYFNLMKVQYPLLADIYELNLALFKDKRHAGQCIGYFDYPIEKTLHLILANYPFEHKYHQLALNIRQRQALHTNPAFFDHWQ